MTTPYSDLLAGMCCLAGAIAPRGTTQTSDARLLIDLEGGEVHRIEATCDLGLVIPTTEEFKYLRDYVGFTAVADTRYAPDEYLTFLIHSPSGRPYRCRAVILPDMGMDTARAQTSKLLDRYSPKILLNLGIAGAVGGDVGLGDVICATGVTNYFHNPAVSGSAAAPLTLANIERAMRSYRSDYGVTTFVRNLSVLAEREVRDWQSTALDWLRKKLDAAAVESLSRHGLEIRGPRVLVGELASGPFLGASNQFREWLRTLNRQFLGLDMEAAGFLGAIDEARKSPVSIVLRGVSDPTDDRKRVIESASRGSLREWAVRNAAQVLLWVLGAMPESEPAPVPLQLAQPKASFLELSRQLEDTIAREHLPAFQRGRSADDQAIAAESTLYERFAEVTSLSYPSGGLVANALEIIIRSEDTLPLTVDGNSGSGKTSFLGLLYRYALRQYQSGESGLFPILVSLHRYNSVRDDSAREDVLPAQALHLFNAEFGALEQIVRLHPEQELLVIIDGDDTFAKFRSPLAESLTALLKTHRHKKVVASRKGEGVGRFVGRSSNPRRVAITFVDRMIDDRLPTIIDAFLAVVATGDNERAQEFLTRSLLTGRLGEFDLFTLALLWQRHVRDATRSPAPAKLADLIQEYCEASLEGAGVPSERVGDVLERAAQLAFEFEILRTEDEAKAHEPRDGMAWSLVHLHLRVRDFLVARHIMHNVKEYAEGSTQEEFGYVYPHRINRSCKEILNSSHDAQDKVFRSLERARTTSNLNFLSQLSYLAGRIEDDQIRERAREVLREIRTERLAMLNDPKDERRRLHLLRTIYISQVYLKEESALAEYLERVLTDEAWDRLNRGFHLEYYGDVPYNPRQPLVHADPGGPFPRTFWQLAQRLQARRESPLYELELVTLVSLAQHRHGRGALEDRVRSTVLELVTTALQRRTFSSDMVRSYLELMSGHLSDPGFKVGAVLARLLEIKAMPREGWRRRGIERGESVADHMYGSALLAMLLLPERTTKGGDYSKGKILRMLLLHDLAEAITGDIVPAEKTEQHRDEENRVMMRLSLLGTYQDFPGAREMLELWREFRSDVSLNARIARGFEKLDCLAQLLIYRRAGYEIDGLEEWKRALLEAIAPRVFAHSGGQLLIEYFKSPSDGALSDGGEQRRSASEDLSSAENSASPGAGDPS